MATPTTASMGAAALGAGWEGDVRLSGLGGGGGRRCGVGRGRSRYYSDVDSRTRIKPLTVISCGFLLSSFVSLCFPSGFRDGNQKRVDVNQMMSTDTVGLVCRKRSFCQKQKLEVIFCRF